MDFENLTTQEPATASKSFCQHQKVKDYKPSCTPNSPDWRLSTQKTKKANNQYYDVEEPTWKHPTVG